MAQRSPGLDVARHHRRRCLAVTPGLLAILLLPACSGSDRAAPPPVVDGVRLTQLHYGKLADVYGLRTIAGNRVIELYRSDVLISPELMDERPSSSDRRDDEITYDFISPHPDTLQPRLLITRELGSVEFGAAFAALDRMVRPISADRFGRDPNTAPYPVVPRNATLRLRFSGPLSFTDDDLYSRDTLGRITGYKNAAAIQLLEILGDPTDNKFDGDFRVVPMRTVVRGDEILLDPVLLGGEGLIYGDRNSASGMPASPDQQGANIRIAVALEGPLAMPGLAPDRFGTLSGRNNDGLVSIIRDFRSGNPRDNSPHLARGFVRDPEPPKLIGEMLMYLERVDQVGPSTRQLTIFKNGIAHEIDRGDVLRMFVDSTGIPLAALEILKDPGDDLGRPAVQRVRLLVRPLLDANGADVLERHDPSNLPGFPSTAGPERDEFLRRHAPRTVLVAEFTGRRPNPAGDPRQPFIEDDPRYFLTFNPTPRPADNGIIIHNENVSPFAAAVVRFSKPMDLASVLPLDTAFFATRDLLDRDAIDRFLKDRNIEPTTFHEAKFRTPHLIHSRVFDQNGSQTALRLQPTLGFYLDQEMRAAADADRNLPFHERRYHYFLHLVSGPGGLTDLSGNPVDFQAAGAPAGGDHLVMEFALDTRTDPVSKLPAFDDNLVVSLVRRMAHPDEDERPNLYLPAEVTPTGAPTPIDAYPSHDAFGPVSYLPTGELAGRLATRSRKWVDNINQIAPPPQSSTLRWCPIRVRNQSPITIAPTTAAVFGQPIQNPLNPYGCRLQTVWRDLDMSLSRTDPADFNLDVEQMYWTPFAQNAVYFDEFDRVSLFLGHSEFRPEPCILPSGFPAFPMSGLSADFALNYAHNLGASGQVGHQPPPHPAFVDAVWQINAREAILDPTGSYRYLPMPKFTDATAGTNLKDPYFVWRDEQAIVQGGRTQVPHSLIVPNPYLLSPFLAGQGRSVTGTALNPNFVSGGWYNHLPANLANGSADPRTDGLAGPLALPLLADFWVHPDSPRQPADDPFVASGINGWQISLATTASPRPDFRAYSAGRATPTPIKIDPTHQAWKRALGGYTPAGGRTPGNDNSFYWVMAEFLKRTSVATFGFIEITNPHRMPAGSDPRLGPFDAKTRGMLPDFTYDFDPPQSQLPPGTSVVAEFRAASELDPASSAVWPKVGTNPTTTDNFPNDPLKAGDAFVRHWDDRGGRDWWTYMYNKTVTTYVEDPNQLMDTKFTDSFSGPKESFTAKDVRYFNWRFIMKNNVEAAPPVSPRIRSFAISYRFTAVANR